MPTTITSENFEGAVTPSIPTGWTADSGIVTTASASNSSPNSLGVSSTTSALNAQYDNADTNSGDVQVTCNLRGSLQGTTGSSGSLLQIWARGQGTCVPQTSATRYEARINIDDNGLQLFKRISGTPTQLVSNIGNRATFSSGVWYRIRLKCSGTTISVQIQRLSDGQWLSSSATWGATQVDCISITNSSITGAGKAGVTFVPRASNSCYADDFLFESLAAAAATAATLTGPASGAVSVASTNFSVSVDGSYTGTVTPASSGSGTFSPTSLSWSGTSNTQTFTYTPSTTVGSPHDISITASPALTYAGSPIAYTVSSPVAIAVNDAALFSSPYNWNFNGSTDCTTNTPGAYREINWTGTSLKMGLNSPAFSGTTLRIRVVTDGFETYNTPVSASATQIIAASGLADAAHFSKIYYDGNDPNQDVFSNNPPTMCLRTTGFVIDAGRTISAVTPRSKRLLFLGDSTGYGISVLRSTSHPAGDAASLAPGFAVAQALDAAIGIRSFGSQGYGKAGLGNAPAVWNSGGTGSWDKYWSGMSMLNGGLFSPAPDFIVCYHGTADYTGSSTDANVTAGVAGLIPSLRAAAPNAQIFVIVPANRQKLSAITAGFESAMTSKILIPTPGQVTIWKGQTDSQCFLADLGLELALGLSGPSGGPSTWAAIDSIHSDVAANGRIAAMIVSAIVAV